jgi:hypothetical protein
MCVCSGQRGTRAAAGVLGGGGLAGRKGVGVAAVDGEVDSWWSAVAGCCTGGKQVRELNKNTCIVCSKTGPNQNRLFYYNYSCTLFTLSSIICCEPYIVLCVVFRLLRLPSTCIFVKFYASILKFFVCLCPGRFRSS